ncbi:MAG TPA: hypothetical protein VJM31_16960 [Vicinamibacterales bacterium]|nr:hypothetical protein [Vicinamibacterales bacterium]
MIGDRRSAIVDRPGPKAQSPDSLARWLSIIAHPFVMVGVMVGTAAAARQSRAAAVRSVTLVVLFTVVPLAVLMIRQVRRGAWENVDASNRRERPMLYFVMAVALVVLLAYVMVLPSQSFMVRGVAATMGMLAVCAVATRWIKVSLHMAFAALAATTLALMGSNVGYLLVFVLPALAWSRLVLKRHSRLELGLGTFAGVVAGIAIRYW